MFKKMIAALIIFISAVIPKSNAQLFPQHKGVLASCGVASLLCGFGTYKVYKKIVDLKKDLDKVDKLETGKRKELVKKILLYKAFTILAGIATGAFATTVVGGIYINNKKIVVDFSDEI
jgi:hypothetical protein